MHHSASKIFCQMLRLLEMILKKIVILRKGIGIESEKVCKQVRDQMVWKQV